MGAGLCGTCAHARSVPSARGVVYLLCYRSRTDAAYARYPALPRLQCAGYDVRADTPAMPGTPSGDRRARRAQQREPAMTTPVTIRMATRADVPVILDFIRQLAEYEHLADEVHATPEALEATLFGERPAAEVVVAAVAGRDVGFALFFETYSTFLAARGMHLEDLFVIRDARGRGVGRALLVHLAALADARGYGRLEWNVLGWNAPAIGFYRRLGAFSLDDWQTFRLNREGLRQLAATGGTSPTP